MQNHDPVDADGYNRTFYFSNGLISLFAVIFLGWMTLSEGALFFFCLSLLVFGGYTISMFYCFIKFKPVEIPEEDLPNPAVDFYKGCIADGVKEITSEQGEARLTLYLKNHNIQMDLASAKQRYEQGKNELQRFAEIKKQKERDKKRNELIDQERKYEELSKKYISFFGQDKAVKMCLDEAAIYHKIVEECNKERSDVYKNAGNAYRAYSQKEHDWAIHGGLASGLAGGAAGLAAASRIANKNQAIRESNQILNDAIYNMAADRIMDIYEKSSAAEKEAERWENRANNLKKCLVQDLPEDELLAKLNPKVISQIKSETNAIEIIIKTSAVNNMLIYKNVPAVVDGCIKAVLWDGDIKVGEAFFALPYCGSISDFTLSSICRSELLEHEKDYTITFEAEKLWAIESSKRVLK